MAESLKIKHRWLLCGSGNISEVLHKRFKGFKSWSLKKIGSHKKDPGMTLLSMDPGRTKPARKYLCAGSLYVLVSIGQNKNGLRHKIDIPDS